MEYFSFQYLKKPFCRSFGEKEVYSETVACMPPTKPYFKGDSNIPIDHPSRMIRNTICEELGVNKDSKEIYPGNANTSVLHQHSDMCRLFLETIQKQTLPESIHSLFTIGSNRIQLSQPFANPLIIIPSNTNHYIIPPQCGFFNGDIFDFIQNQHPFKYDIIEMDPPWPNKSTKRSKVYSASTIDFDTMESFFDQFPVSSFCNDCCWILVWITNDPRCMDCVLHFFEQHGIVHITTAYWIKVTQSMQPLVPLSCPTRETFERIVVGRVLKNDQFEAKRVNIHVSSAKNDFLHHVYQLAGKKAGTHLPERQHPCNPTQLQQIPCLVSTVSFHSRKPNCLEFDFLKLPPNYRGLELFARQLRPFWYSVGNEVFLFQNDQILQSSVQ